MDTSAGQILASAGTVTRNLLVTGWPQVQLRQLKQREQQHKRSKVRPRLCLALKISVLWHKVISVHFQLSVHKARSIKQMAFRVWCGRIWLASLPSNTYRLKTCRALIDQRHTANPCICQNLAERFHRRVDTPFYCSLFWKEIFNNHILV